MRNIKNIIKITLIFSMIFALTSTVYAYSDGNKQNLIEFAKNFILESYSDFSTKEKSPDDFISSNAAELKNFIKDREEILSLYTKISKKDIKPLNSEVVESKIKDLKDDTYEIRLKVNHQYLTTGRKAFMQVVYKIVIKNKDHPKVIAAMSNDISASYLFDTNAVGYDELKLDYQLKDQLKNRSRENHFSTDSYDVKEVKSKLKKLLGTMKDDVKTESEINFCSRNFTYFTKAVKNKMRSYQNRWYVVSNPIITIFKN